MSKIKKILKELLYSLTVIFEGFFYSLKTDRVWIYLFLAIILNIVAFIVVIILVVVIFNLLFVYISGQAHLQVSFLGAFASEVIFLFVAIIFGIVSFSTLSSIINAPIYGKLAEFIKYDKLRQIRSKRSALDEIANALSFEGKKTIIVVFFFLVVFVINLFPGVGQIVFTILSAAELIVVTGLDLFEPVFVDNKIMFRKRLWYIVSNPFKFWLFLFIAGTLCAVPVLSIFTIPIFRASAIILFGKYRS